MHVHALFMPKITLYQATRGLGSYDPHNSVGGVRGGREGGAEVSSLKLAAVFPNSKLY